MVNNKLTKWQAEHGSEAWAESLMEICEAINSETHEFLAEKVAPFQLMISQNELLGNI